MAELISEIWAGLREAGLPEVMLYLPDQTASRCHWDETTMIGVVRVALLADQERKIVRILPVDSCVGIGIASPKGTDPSGYKSIVYDKIARRYSADGSTLDPPDEPAPAPVAAKPEPPPPPAAPAPESPPPPKAEPMASRWGMPSRAPQSRYTGPTVAGTR